MCSSDVFKNAMRLGTFPAILMTYTASALLHVSMMLLHTFGGEARMTSAAEGHFLVLTFRV